MLDTAVEIFPYKRVACPDRYSSLVTAAVYSLILPWRVEMINPFSIRRVIKVRIVVRFQPRPFSSAFSNSSAI